jgi:nucleoside-diphosphate-sugar epimerase
MVYGPTKKGNLYRLIAAIDRGWFPSLPPVSTVRSMLYVKNFVLAVVAALTSETVPKSMYVVTDEKPYSVTEICDLLRKGLGLAPPRRRVPRWVISCGGWCGDILEALTGRPMPLTSSTVEKLFDEAWYSPEAMMRDLGYQPQYSFDSVVPELIEHYCRMKS